MEKEEPHRGGRGKDEGGGKQWTKKILPETKAEFNHAPCQTAAPGVHHNVYHRIQASLSTRLP